MAVAAACGPQVRSITGIVTYVGGGGPASVDAFRVRSADGTELTLQVDRRLDIVNGLPAAHLREHLATGVPIVVEYVVESGGNAFALRYTDAVVPSTSP